MKIGIRYTKDMQIADMIPTKQNEEKVPKQTQSNGVIRQGYPHTHISHCGSQGSTKNNKMGGTFPLARNILRQI